MRLVTKLFGLWALGRATSSTTPLILRLCTSIAAIAFSAMFLLMLIVSLILGALWVFYSYLVSIGVDAGAAKLMVVMVILLLMFTAAMIIQFYIAKIRDNVRAIAFARAPLSGRFTYIVDAFVRGFSKP